MTTRHCHFRMPNLLTLCCVMIVAQPAGAQILRQAIPNETMLIVEGTVERIFQRDARGSRESLVQIAVRRAEVAGETSRSGLRFPAPGESVYVLVGADSDASARLTNRRAATPVPQEGDSIRAYLKGDDQGLWMAVAGDWFAALGADNGSRTPVGTDRDRSESGQTTAVALGMTMEVVQIQGRLALRVTRLDENGAGRRAGLEVGDVVVGVNGQGINRVSQLDDLLRDAESVNLTVIDVNSGRLADVQVAGRGAGSGTDPAATPREVDLPPRRSQPATPSLGISAERVSLGLRSALKVIRVEPDSPAAKAGLEVGDVLVKANGVPLTSPEQLVAAIRKGGGVLTLSVRDVRTGRDVAVDVNLTGAEPRADATPRSAPRSEPGRMGVVTEVAFYDVEAAVKITEVEPGSPAERAGLTPGLLILEADGKSVLHPNDLAQAERSGRSIRLTVVDPRTGRKNAVTVNLR